MFAFGCKIDAAKLSSSVLPHSCSYPKAAPRLYAVSEAHRLRKQSIIHWQAMNNNGPVVQTHASTNPDSKSCRPFIRLSEQLDKTPSTSSHQLHHVSALTASGFRAMVSQFNRTLFRALQPVQIARHAQRRTPYLFEENGSKAQP